MRVSLAEALGLSLVCVFAYFIANDWLVSLSLAVFWLLWKLTLTEDRLYVLPLAMTFQWVQSTLGLLYFRFIGRPVDAIYKSNYEPMVLIALGCCVALAGGLFVGRRLVKGPSPHELRPEFAFPLKLLIIIYVTTIFLEGGLNTLVREYPSFRQIVTNFDEARLAILYLLLRRWYSPTPQWTKIAGVVGFEVILGITGFFAGFREPLILAALAMLEIFDRRNVRHWVAAGAVATVAVAVGLLWMGIRSDYRRDYVELDNFRTNRSARIARIGDLASGFVNSDVDSFMFTVDNLVDRMWPIYYPALAVARVPGTLPHTNGSIFNAALQHITMPRVFFPEKGDLASDSEMVRKYAGVFVAGQEAGTSIAFGYAAESYIDFGLPWMFLPVFGFALFMGIMYQLFSRLIRHRELAVAYLTVAFWFSMYLFERSWVLTLGEALGFIIYIGVPLLLLDRFLLVRQEKLAVSDGGLLFPNSRESEI